MAQRLQDELSAFFFEYDTPRMVLVRNKKVGVVFRLIQFVVLVYVIGWVFVYEKGYQTSSGLISSVSVKLKGLAVTQLPGLGPQVWDVADYVFPAQGDSSFVIMTNFIATPGRFKATVQSTQKGAYAQMTLAAPQGRQKGRPKVSAQASVWPSTTLCRHVRSLAGVPWRWTTTSHALPFSKKPRTSLSSSRTASAFHASRSTGATWWKRWMRPT
uniref:Uncharacterized protein n=1 Tax=Lynx canadensis TaxID=61383 RepID=A0A667ILS9_LYNCA